MLTEEQIGAFNEQGFLRIPQVYTPDEVEALREELDQLIQDWATTQPFRNPADLEHFVDGMALAGLAI